MGRIVVGVGIFGLGVTILSGLLRNSRQLLTGGIHANQ